MFEPIRQPPVQGFDSTTKKSLFVGFSRMFKYITKTFLCCFTYPQIRTSRYVTYVRERVNFSGTTVRSDACENYLNFVHSTLVFHSPPRLMGCPLGYGTAEGGPAVAALDATLDAKVVGRYGDEWLPAPNFLVSTNGCILMHWTTPKHRTCIRGAHQRSSSMVIAETGA